MNAIPIGCDPRSAYSQHLPRIGLGEGEHRERAVAGR